MLDVVELESDVFSIAATVPDTRPRDAIRVGGVLVSSNFPVVSRIDANAENIDVEAVADIAQKPSDAALVRRPGGSPRPTLPVTLIPVGIIVILKVVERPHETLLGVGLSN